MLDPGRKLAYFLTCAAQRLSGQGMACPSCGERRSEVVARKYLVSSLRRCAGCGVQFRAPTTSPAAFARYYQTAYAEGFTTDLPDDATLARWLATGFADTEKDYAPYLAVLAALDLPAGARVLDFGCSWGYGSWQLARAGYAVSACEISAPRRAFAATRLGIDAHARLEAETLRGPFDLFFSAHVLEHTAALAEVLAQARRLVRPGGWFVAFTPNGGEAYRRRDPAAWQSCWGFVHPLHLDAAFYARAFAARDALCDSHPYDLAAIKAWAGAAPVAGRFHALRPDGPELLLIARL